MEKQTLIKVARKTMETAGNLAIGFGLLLVTGQMVPALPALVQLGFMLAVAYLLGRGFTSVTGLFDEEKSDEDIRG